VAINLGYSDLTAFAILTNEVGGFDCNPTEMEGCSVEINGKVVNVAILTNPSFLTTATNENNTLKFILINEGNASENFQNVTYDITITNLVTNKIVLSGLFHSSSNSITLGMRAGGSLPSNSSVPFISHEKIFDSPPNATLNIASFLHTSGLYHIHTGIVSFDNYLYFKPELEPQFDSWIDIWGIEGKEMNYKNQSFNAKILSPIGNVTDFKFDPEKRVISWSVPFDWNLTSFVDYNVIRQDLRIPISFYKVLESEDQTNKTNLYSFNATMNGFPLPENRFLIDPYSVNNSLSFHFALSKNDMMMIAGKLPMNTTQMTFSIFPSQGSSAPEFPFVASILVGGFASLIVLYRLKFRIK
jgi:hypothetical protein